MGRRPHDGASGPPACKGNSTRRSGVRTLAYALALDARKRPCRVRTSNPGHCLFTGIASQDRAGRVADASCRIRRSPGWGVRTVAAGAARYSPMSYHNGSIWPHDNALVAAGLARYGFTGCRRPHHGGHVRLE